jgi:hypothetical protein
MVVGQIEGYGIDRCIEPVLIERVQHEPLHELAQRAVQLFAPQST